MTMVARKARIGWTPASISPTKFKAANSTMTPCAKLNMPEALKISTKPRATSEYITPDIRPAITTSARNSGASAISKIGPAKKSVKNSTGFAPSP